MADEQGKGGDHGGAAPGGRSPGADGDDVYSLDTTPGAFGDGDGESDAGERTGLLGGPGDGDGDAPRKDSWAGFDEFAGLPWYRVPSISWLVGPYAVLMLAMGGSLVPKLNLIIDLICRRHFADRVSRDAALSVAGALRSGLDNPQCKIPEVQQSVAAFILVLNVILGVLSSFTVPRLGSLSDRYGRKRVMAFSSACALAGEVITIVAATYPDAVSYRWIILGSALDGLGGSITANNVLCHSYTSDCTPPSKRGVAIGYLHSCMYVGMAFGPLATGFFAKWTGSLVSIFYVVLACHACYILYILFVLPESISEKRQHQAREAHAREEEAKAQRLGDWAAAQEPGGPEATGLPRRLGRGAARAATRAAAGLRAANPFEPLRALIPAAPRLRRNLLLLAFVDVAMLGSALASGQVTILYSEFLFGWGNFETSAFVSMLSLVRVLVLLTLFPLLHYLFRARPAARRRRDLGAIAETHGGADELDVWLLRVALVSDLLGQLGYVAARAPAVFVLAGAVSCLGGLGSATIQSALTKHVPADRVGRLLGAIGLLHALSRVVAPVLFNGLYAATVKSFPQAVFVLMSAIFAVALLLAMLVQPHVYMEESDEDPHPYAARQDEATRSQDTLEDEEIMPSI